MSRLYWHTMTYGCDGCPFEIAFYLEAELDEANRFLETEREVTGILGTANAKLSAERDEARLRHQLRKIGSPPQSVVDWLTDFAADCERAASGTVLPWRRSAYRARAQAYRTAAALVARAALDDPEPSP